MHLPQGYDDISTWNNAFVSSLTKTVYIGCHYSLDWTTGLEYWTGILDWNTGLDYWTEVFSFFGQEYVVFQIFDT